MVHDWAGRGGHALVASQHGRLEVRMTAGMLDQVVAAHEALITQWTQEAFFSRVGAGVAGELIGAGKLLLAVGPGAREGPLTCVCPDMCLQVGRFPVNSVASVKSALMSLHRGARGPHASSSSSPPQLLLSGDRGGGGGHGRGGRVGQRGVTALSTARGVATLRVGRHGAELTVQVGEDTGHRHHVRPLQPQRVPHLPVLARPVGLPGEQAHGGRLAGRDDRGGSVQDRTAGYRHQTLGSEIIRRSSQRHCYLPCFVSFRKK